MKPVITLDLDGVIAEGGYIPKEDRTASKFLSRSLLEPVVCKRMWDLVEKFTVYIITARDPEAYSITHDWLRNRANVNIGGLICTGDRRKKAQLSWDLGAIAHFDDDPRVLDEWWGSLQESRHYLVDNPMWQLNQDDSQHPRVMNWQDIMKVCYDLLQKEKKQ